MADRMTRPRLEAKVQTVNRLLGFRDVTYRTVGAIELQYAYGGVQVGQITEGHGISTLSTDGYGTMAQAGTFLDGMMAALRIRQQLPGASTSTPRGMLTSSDPRD